MASISSTGFGASPPIGTSKSLTRSREPREMFRRIDPTTRAEIEQKINDLPEGYPTGMLKAFRDGTYSNPVFEKDNWVLYAMRAFATGKIPRDVHAGLMLYDECSTNFSNLRVLKGDDAITKHQESLTLSFKEEFLTEDTDHFFDSLDQTDEIFIIDFNENLMEEEDPCLHDLICATGYLFVNKSDLYVFSPKTLNKFYKYIRGIRGYDQEGNRSDAVSCLHPHTPIHMNLVHGYSPDPSEFADAAERDVFIPNRYVPVPDIHDFTECSGLSVYWHDLYHVRFERLNPHRALWIHIANVFKAKRFEVCKKLKKDPRFNIYEALLDREFAAYHPTDRLLKTGKSNWKLDQIFWLQIADIRDYILRYFVGLYQADSAIEKIHDFLEANTELLARWNITCEKST